MFAVWFDLFHHASRIRIRWYDMMPRCAQRAMCMGQYVTVGLCRCLMVRLQRQGQGGGTQRSSKAINNGFINTQGCLSSHEGQGEVCSVWGAVWGQSMGGSVHPVAWCSVVDLWWETGTGIEELPGDGRVKARQWGRSATSSPMIWGRSEWRFSPTDEISLWDRRASEYTCYVPKAVW